MKTYLGWMQLACLAVGTLTGCAGSGSSEQVETGTAALPLRTYGPTGASYRLRNAVFQLAPYRYYWDLVGAGGSYVATDATAGAAGAAMGGATSIGEAGAPSTAAGGSPVTDVVVVNSEDDPDADSINVELEQGEYLVQLLPGWSMEKSFEGSTETVEAQLLNGADQWLWISPHSTSWVSYQFGIGDRSLWFNGEASINIEVYENPSDYYGGVGGATNVGGSTGAYPAGGSPSTAGAAGASVTGGAGWAQGGSTGY